MKYETRIVNYDICNINNEIRILKHELQNVNYES